MTVARYLLFIALLMPVATTATATDTVWQLNISGAIGPATSDYVVRGLEQAEDQAANLVVLQIDTPGGLDLAMRDIIQAILAADIPVACLVAPSGARAASAGTYILYACHYAAMAPATNLGAATPVQIGTPSLPGNPKDKTSTPTPSDSEKDNASKPDESVNAPASPSAMEKKIINDAVAYIEGLARLRNRNVAWAVKAVKEGASLTAEEALDLNVIDAIAENTINLIALLDGQQFEIHDRDITLHTAHSEIVVHEPDWRSEFLSVITNPNVAYILMLIGIYGLFFEFSNPGMGVPGIAGAVCLLLALYAFQVLPVSYAGVALILLGIGLMAGEAVSPSFGALGLGGVIAFVVGSIILMDTDLPGYQIAMPLIAAFTAFSAVIVFAIIALVIKSRKQSLRTGLQHLVGMPTTVALLDSDQAMVRLDGELWQVDCDQPLATNDRVTVTGIDGLRLQVKKD